MQLPRPLFWGANLPSKTKFTVFPGRTVRYAPGNRRKIAASTAHPYSYLSACIRRHVLYMTRPQTLWAGPLSAVFQRISVHHLHVSLCSHPYRMEGKLLSGLFPSRPTWFCVFLEQYCWLTAKRALCSQDFLSAFQIYPEQLFSLLLYTACQKAYWQNT